MPSTEPTPNSHITWEVVVPEGADPNDMHRKLTIQTKMELFVAACADEKRFRIGAIIDTGEKYFRMSHALWENGYRVSSLTYPDPANPNADKEDTPESLFRG